MFFFRGYQGTHETISPAANIAFVATPATLQGDFTAIASTAGSISAGSTSLTVPVTIKGDLIQEGNEQFTLDISGATNVAAATAQGTGTIQDDDTVPAISINNVSVTEGGTATFTITLVP